MVHSMTLCHEPLLNGSTLDKDGVQTGSAADQIEKTGIALTADELVRVLSVSRITIFEQAKAGRIPSFPIGTCVRFVPKVVANWLRRM